MGTSQQHLFELRVQNRFANDTKRSSKERQDDVVRHQMPHIYWLTMNTTLCWFLLVSNYTCCRNYFMDSWNIVDVATILLSFVTIAMWVVKVGIIIYRTENINIFM
jgi:hypothetical protein